ncbi:MAG TPA: hypothetical protein VF435_00960 [Pyrinomonadaceae bacterium]
MKFAGGQTSIEVYQEVQPGVWQPQYEFTAAIAGDTSPNLAVSSPEFFTWQNRLYIAFVTADVPDFSSATSGNIWITRVDVDDANPERELLLVGN